MTKTIEISDETWEKIKGMVNQDEIVEINEVDDMIGNKYFFRTVTYHLIGKVEKRIGNILQLSGASWVADSGRFMNAIKDGKLNEVEPVGIAFVNMSSVTDFFPWKHKLPTDQI